MTIAADYPFLDIFGSMFAFFIGLAWIAVVILVFVDVFRRHDLSGWGKAAWIVALLVFPIFGLLAYLIANGTAMSQRDSAAAGGGLPGHYDASGLSNYYDPQAGGRVGTRPRMM